MLEAGEEEIKEEKGRSRRSIREVERKGHEKMEGEREFSVRTDRGRDCGVNLKFMGC